MLKLAQKIATWLEIVGFIENSQKIIEKLKNFF